MAKVEGGGEKVDDDDLMCDSRVFFPMNVMAQKAGAGVKKGVDFRPLCMHGNTTSYGISGIYGISMGLTGNHLPPSFSVDKS